MNPRKDWSWRTDAETRKALDVGAKKIKAAKAKAAPPKQERRK
jgi:hypothetical protein